MYINFDAISSGQAYACMTRTLLPRPIAWVLSENADGSHNLAPFSYFNAVCSDPPLIMLSIGRKPDGTPKDTRDNIVARSRFVVHIAHASQAEALNASAAGLAAGQSEATELGLATTPFEDFALPRLSDCRVAYACERYQVQYIGRQQQALILGQIHAAYIDDRIATQDAQGRLQVDAARLDPLCRLGGNDYSSLHEILSLDRPD